MLITNTFSNYHNWLSQLWKKIDFRCVEKPDPCNPSPCGPGTMCMANTFGNAICRCLEGLVPKPDTITGCQPECEVKEAFCYGKVRNFNFEALNWIIINGKNPEILVLNRDVFRVLEQLFKTFCLLCFFCFTTCWLDWFGG